MRNSIFYAAVALLFLLTVFVRGKLERAEGSASFPADPRRIVSLAPSVTETLYALGLGPRVVGVTQFCAYPPEALLKPRVAGFSDVNLEAVVRVIPDLAVLPLDKAASREQLERLGIPVLPVDTLSLRGFTASVEALGNATGHAAEAAAIVNAFEHALYEARRRAAGKVRPRVLFSVMRAEEGLGRITEINAAGRDGFYNELIAAAGGENVYKGVLAFPRLSREAIIFFDPEVIIDVVPGGDDARAARLEWESLESVAAVRAGRIVLLTEAADTVPGPRSVATLEKLSRAFHPDAAVEAGETGGGVKADTPRAGATAPEGLGR